MRFFPVNIKQLFLLRKLKQDNGYIKKKFKMKVFQNIIWILQNIMKES